MMQNLPLLVVKAHKRFAGIPPIFDQDRCSLWGKVGTVSAAKLLTELYASLAIPYQLHRDSSQERDFFTLCSTLMMRFHTLCMRGILIGQSVEYDSLPAMKDSYMVKDITEEFMVVLANGAVCHPLWLRVV